MRLRSILTFAFVLVFAVSAFAERSGQKRTVIIKDGKVITDDVRGAYAMDEANIAWFIPRYPDPRPPYEITGAGDAFASTTVAALAMGKDLQTALMWGATNASSVLQEIGAQRGLLKRDQLEKNLANPPAPFAVRPL